MSGDALEVPFTAEEVEALRHRRPTPEIALRLWHTAHFLYAELARRPPAPPQQSEALPCGGECQCEDVHMCCEIVGKIYRCTRSEGHEGEHVACGSEKHDLARAPR